AVPDVREVSIGHALIGEALYAGLEATVRAYRRIVDGASTA
ncbi:pyridoxine 5'-phosphate synthase, partial [Bacillus cereus]